MNVKSAKYGYGNFGNLSQNYAKARQEFPVEVIDWFWSFFKDKDIHVLDLGCGTGISTRQIAKQGGAVVGCDKDELMIVEAIKYKDGLEYVVAAAEKLPFRDNQFDALTAFSAFHWFVNEEALNEIKRVLKPSGFFYVANKNDMGDFKKGYKDIIKSVLGYNLPEAKKDYEPAALLSAAGFSSVQIKDFETIEYFTVSEALQYLQSVSLWNLVPDDLRQKTLEKLEHYCQQHLENGKTGRKLNVRAAIAKK